MSSTLWEHVTNCGWECLTYSILGTLVTPSPSHFWIAFSVLLNWPLWTLCHIQVYPIGAVPISMEPVRMIFGGVSAPPAPQRGIYPTCCLSYGLFGHIHTHIIGLPVVILWASLIGKWVGFLFPPVRRISIMKPPSWSHESHLSLFPFIFISHFWRS